MITQSNIDVEDAGYFVRSTNILRIRNCSEYSEPTTSHALGELAGSRRTLLHMQQRAAGTRHIKIRFRQLMSIWRTILPNFIPIRFETTEH